MRDPLASHLLFELLQLCLAQQFRRTNEERTDVANHLLVIEGAEHLLDHRSINGAGKLIDLGKKDRAVERVVVL